MHELVLGSVDSGANGQLNDLLKDGDPQLRSGRFHLLGCVDDATGTVRSGALVRNIGNDQWSVYLLNEQQLEKVAHSELCDLRREANERGGAINRALLEQSTGLGAMKSTAELLGLSGETRVAHLARKLASEGVLPTDVARVHEEAKHMIGGHGVTDAAAPAHRPDIRTGHTAGGLELER